MSNNNEEAKKTTLKDRMRMVEDIVEILKEVDGSEAISIIEAAAGIMYSHSDLKVDVRFKSKCFDKQLEQ